MPGLHKCSCLRAMSFYACIDPVGMSPPRANRLVCLDDCRRPSSMLCKSSAHLGRLCIQTLCSEQHA